MRLIDADALIDFIDMGHLRNPLESCFSERDVVDMLESRPTVDAVEVVRCKDCVHSRELDKFEKQLYLLKCVGCTKHSKSYSSVVMLGDDFCSYGERKENE